MCVVLAGTRSFKTDDVLNFHVVKLISIILEKIIHSQLLYLPVRDGMWKLSLSIMKDRRDIKTYRLNTLNITFF